MSVDTVDIAGDAETLLALKAEDDPRTIPEMKAADDTWTDGKVVEVREYTDGTHYDTLFEEFDNARGHAVIGGKTGIGVPKIDGKPAPEVGDVIRVYGRFGGPVHGIDVNGVEVYWDTPWERFSKRIKMLAGFDRDRRERFVEDKERLDAIYEGLPAPLKARIDRFRAEREDFRVDGEAYEMASVGDAPKIARALAVKEGWRLDEDCRAIHVSNERIDAVVKEFFDLSYDEQTKLVPDLDKGHSGNTFAGAVRLAFGLLVGQDL